MAENEKYTKWEPKTMDCIRQNSSIFKSVAARMGISAEALAGAMAKENNQYQLNTAVEVFKDRWALGTISGEIVDHAQWSAQYDAVKKSNWIDNADRLRKIRNPILVDLGPFNLQGATAIRALIRYIQANPHSDPFDLKQYQGDYAKFLSTIAGPDAAPWNTLNAEESVRVNAIVWGMQIKQAQDWFEKKKRGDERFAKLWDGKPQKEKDAFYAQWCFFGPRKMEERFVDNINDSKHRGTYKPELGEGGSDVHKNAGAIGIAMDNFGYAAEGQNSDSEKTASAAGAPASPSNARITYNTDGTVTVNKGGTLWEICEEQRKKGNPITPDDLRLKNKNIEDVDDTRIPVGTKLVIPRRQEADSAISTGDKSNAADYQGHREDRRNLFGGSDSSRGDIYNTIENEDDNPRVISSDPSVSSPLQHVMDALGVASKDVHLIPDGDNENPMPGSYSIMDKSTSKEIGSCLMTTTGCEMTAGDRKVVMDKISGNDVSLQTYAKNDEGEYELLGTTRIGDNDGITVRRPFAGLA